MFNESTLSEIKSRLDIVDLVADHVTLKKAGRNWKGLCPFHQEHTPSFIVSQDKQIFHCFGCHEGGDLFGFVMKIESLSFKEAVERLAEQAGVVLLDPKGPPSLSKDEKEQLYQANRVSAWCYHENLKHSPQAQIARDYFQKRGISDREIEQFRLGYALPQGDLLAKVLKERKISLESALKVGVLRDGERGLYENFRGRVIFPIFNREQKVVGLGGRILESSSEIAKYINSSDSPIYDKSQQLYALHLAKEAIRKKNRAILVEGYLDVIALHQFGFQEGIAPLGTALTPKQITILKRYTDHIFLCFDGDDAGWKATARSLDLFLEQGLSPKVILLEKEEDPDSFLRKFGKEAFEKKIKSARNLFEVFIDKTLSEFPRDISGKTASLQALKPSLLKLQHSIERNLYIRRLGEKLEVPESWIFEELGLKAEESNKTQAIRSLPQQKGVSPEETLLEIFVQFSGLRKPILEKIQPDDFIEERWRILANFLWKPEFYSLSSISELSTKLLDEGQGPQITAL
ncbi:MAG: DNA primase, partial [Deltaproteobacteria bacterium]|nr:DNA primase [Deltaproteobacteria bacterium]